MSDSRLYSRLLLPKGHGFPLFHPAPFDDLPVESRMSGTQIGDVGVITADGSFDVLFNICRPAGDPLNRFGVPEGFEPILLEAEDIASRTQYFRPGSDVSNMKIQKRRLDLEAGLDGNVFSPLGIGAVVEIASASTGASTGILLLPDGGSRSDLRRLKRFRDHAIKHAQRWYSFVNHDLERIIDNGDLYLVTGVDKCSTWSVAALENHTQGRGLSLKLKAFQAASANTSCVWEWEVASSFANSGPRRGPGEERWKDNQTVFLRGFKVAIRSTIFGKSPQVLSVAVNSKPAKIFSSNRFGFFSQHGGGAGGDITKSPSPDSSASDEQKYSRPYHPANIINEHLLQSCPGALVSIVHDSEWASVLHENEVLPSDEELVRRIQDKYWIETRSDVVYLEQADATGGAEEDDSESFILADVPGQEDLVSAPDPSESAERIPSISPSVASCVEHRVTFPGESLPLPAMSQDIWTKVFNVVSSKFNQEFESPSNQPTPNHESLRHVGESVLSLAVTSLIHEMYPKLRVDPSKDLRSMLLCEDTLAKIAVEYKLMDHMLSPAPTAISKAECEANLLKAVVGGVYTSEGYNIIRSWLDIVFPAYCTVNYQVLQEKYRMSSPQLQDNKSGMSPASTSPPYPFAISPPSTPQAQVAGAQPSVSRLNTYAQKNNCQFEWAYQESLAMNSDSPALNKQWWSAEISLDGEVLGRGDGANKKVARNEAAALALHRLGVA